MKTLTKTIKAYKFEELTEDVKSTVCNRFAEIDNYSISEKITDDFKEYLTENASYFTDINVNWSLSNCQGDGVSFSAKVDLNKYLKLYHPKIKNSIFDALCNYVFIYSTGNTGWYAFCSLDDIQFEIDCDTDCVNFTALVNKITDGIAKKYMELCYKLEKIGYSEMEYNYSEENAKNRSKDYNIMFEADGTEIDMDDENIKIID